MADTSVGFLILARDQASGAFRKVGRSADITGSKMRLLGKAGKMAGLGLAAGVAAAGVAAYQFGKAAVEDEKSASLMARQFQRSAGATKAQVAATEAWISKQGLAKGVADDQLRPALSSLVTATHSVSKAQQLASLAMDISAAKGKDLGTVSTALMKAQNGQVGGLGRLGIATKDAHGKTKTFLQLQKDLSAQFRGAAAKNADTAAGKMARLKVAFSEAGESIGYKLLPFLTTLVTWMVNKGIPAIGRFGDWFKVKVLPILKDVGNFIGTKMIPWFRSFGDQQSKTGQKTKEFGSTLGGLFSSIKSIFQTASVVASAFWGKYGGLITKYGIGTLRNLLTVTKGAFNVIAGYFKFFSSVIKGDWSGAWKGIQQIARGQIGIVKGLIAQVWNVIKFEFRAGKETVKTLFHQLWIAVRSEAKALPGQFLQIGKWIISGLIKGIGSMGGALKNKMQSMAGDAAGWFKSKLGIHSPSKVFHGYGANIVQGLLNGIDSKKNTVKLVMDRLTNMVKAKMDRLSTLKGIKSGFLGMFSADSSLGTDLSEGGGFGAILANAMQTSSKASGFNSDVKKLIGKGLSKSLLTQLRDQGFGGADQVHALAGASASQIAQLNAANKATNASLQAAGLTVGNTLRGGNIDTQISAAQRQLNMEKAVERALSKMHLTTEVKGSSLVVILKAYNRERGQTSAGI